MCGEDHLSQIRSHYYTVHCIGDRLFTAVWRTVILFIQILSWITGLIKYVNYTNIYFKQQGDCYCNLSYVILVYSNLERRVKVLH